MQYKKKISAWTSIWDWLFESATISTNYKIVCTDSWYYLLNGHMTGENQEIKNEN